MILSDEQMAAVNGPQEPGAWARVPLPADTTVPDWMLGLEIDWCSGYSHAPLVRFLMPPSYNHCDWPDKVWQGEEGGRYIARHPDGRATVLYHRGEVTPDAAAWRVYLGDKPFTFQWIVPAGIVNGESWEDAARREGTENINRILGNSKDDMTRDLRGDLVPTSLLRLEVKRVSITAAQWGFGGDRILIQMGEGHERILRGPWHGSPPPGYVEMHNSGTCSITHDLFLRAMARFRPELGVVLINGTRMEPYDPAWGMPREHIFDLERIRREAQTPAGPHHKIYWGSETPKFGVDLAI